MVAAVRSPAAPPPVCYTVRRSIITHQLGRLSSCCSMCVAMTVSPSDHTAARARRAAGARPMRQLPSAPHPLPPPRALHGRRRTQPPPPRQSRRRRPRLHAPPPPTWRRRLLARFLRCPAGRHFRTPPPRRSRRRQRVGGRGKRRGLAAGRTRRPRARARRPSCSDCVRASMLADTT